jgi:pro-kumamolisin-like protein/Big-like domain-containing protein
MNLTRISKIGILALSALASIVFSANLLAQSQVAPRRVVQAVDPNDRVAVVQSARPWVRKSTDLGQVSGNTVASHMLLLLGRSSAQQQALTEYLTDLQNPGSPSYHHWLTQAQFADAYGVNIDDVQAVTAWLESQGLAIEKVAKARNLIEFSGTVDQVQRAFQANIHRLSVSGARNASNEATSLSAIQVPRALAPVIRGLVNLDGAHAHSLARPGRTAKYDPATRRIKPVSSPDLTLFGGAGPILYVDPADAAVIYDTPNAMLNPNYKGSTLDGGGVTVGVVGASNVDLTGVSLYRQAFLGETSSNVNLPTVVVDGNDPGINGDEIETFLDLEVLGGIAPKANIYYYASNSTDLTDGLQTAIARAVDDNLVSILSISYGSCEADQGTAGNAFFSEIYQQAAAQGISVTVSSGDSGSANCDNPDSQESAANGLAVNGLASTPYNIAVGGTDYDVLGSSFETYVNDQSSGTAPYYLTASQYIPEEPWNDSTIVNTSVASNVALEPGGTTNIIAAGGGVSSVYTKPAYQTALTPADGGRDVPDVSFLAGNGLYSATWVICVASIGGDDCQTTNGQFTDSTTFTGVGGTSAATPAFAGMLALVEQSTGSRLGQANNILYQLASNKYSTVFHDITTGNNSVVCGSGSPNCGSNGFLTGYDTATGYDLASGLGSVDAAAMVKNWNTAVANSTSTTLTINGATTPLNITHGAGLNFNVAVTPATTSGTAALVANTAALGGQLSIPITKGAGSASYNGLPGGNYTVYARYGGDSTDAASSSTPISVTVAPEASTTGVTINSYDPYGHPITALNSIPYGSYVFAEASVFGTAEGSSGSEGLATGTITYTDNGSDLGKANISSLNYASFPNLIGGVNGSYFFPAGTHSVVASYPGDASYKASTSAPGTFTVTQGVTQIQVAPNTPTTTSVRNDIIYVYILTAGIGNGPTGTVTLQANGVTLGTTTNIVGGNTAQGLTVGIASFNIAGSQFIVGANALTATYTGDNNYTGGSGSGNVTMVPATFSLAASAINLTAGATSGNTAVIRATPLNDFTGVVNLACAVTTAPASTTSPVTCTVPASIDLTGLNPVSGTLTANTTSSTSAGAYVITVTGTDAATGKITETTTSTVTVTGGTPVTPAIALSSSGSITLTPGAATGNSATISITPSGGFTGAVALACNVTSSPTGASDPISCALSSPSVAVSGSGAVTSTLTVTSTAASASVVRGGFGLAGVLVAAVLLLLPARKRLASLACVIAFISFAGILSGCGGSSHSSIPTNPGTTAGTYVVTVTGTASGAASASTTVSVTVN